jgi:hypothetical protein
MSHIKRLIEDVAEDVSNRMSSEKLEFEVALVRVLKDRQFIERDSDEDTIRMWSDNIAHMVA